MSAMNHAQMIAAAITPYVGQMMARSSIELHCKRLGFDSSNLDPKQVEALLAQLCLALKIFIGRDKSEAVIAQIRNSLSGGRS